MLTRLPVALACVAIATAVSVPYALAQRSSGTSTERRVIVSHTSGAYLGVGVAEVDAERAKALNLKEERGVEVKSVTPDSPAAKAGVKENDVVVEYNGQPVQGVEQFQRLVRETPVGRQAKLAVWRGGASQTLSATLEARKGPMAFHGGGNEFTFHMPEIPRPVMPDMSRLEGLMSRSPMLGVQCESLNPQLAEYFGVKDGVLVTSVTRNSAAEKAGVKAGDIITKVEDRKVKSAREITSAIRSLKNRKGFPVTLVRNKKEMTVTVSLDDLPSGGGTRARATRPIAYC
jgi:serine protease Do